MFGVTLLSHLILVAGEMHQRGSSRVHESGSISPDAEAHGRAYVKSDDKKDDSSSPVSMLHLLSMIFLSSLLLAAILFLRYDNSQIVIAAKTIGDMEKIVKDQVNDLIPGEILRHDLGKTCHDHGHDLSIYTPSGYPSALFHQLYCTSTSFYQHIVSHTLEPSWQLTLNTIPSGV